MSTSSGSARLPRSAGEIPEMGVTSMIVTILYYVMAAFIAVLLIWNFMKSRKLQDEILYIIVLLPFVLRLLRLK